MCSTTQYLRNLIEGFGFTQCIATPIFTDSAASVFLAFNPSSAMRTRHIAPKCHQVRRQQTARKVIKPIHIPGQDNLADINTKSLGPMLFQRFRAEIMGYANIQYPVGSLGSL